MLQELTLIDNNIRQIPVQYHGNLLEIFHQQIASILYLLSVLLNSSLSHESFVMLEFKDADRKYISLGVYLPKWTLH